MQTILARKAAHGLAWEAIDDAHRKGAGPEERSHRITNGKFLTKRGDQSCNEISEIKKYKT
jgi:hypothetical protein